MSRIAILGAGAFGTALAISLARDGRGVSLWARDPAAAAALRDHRENWRHLPGHPLPPDLAVTSDLAAALDGADPVLLAVPMQALGAFLQDVAPMLGERRLVACCKGIDLGLGIGPVGLLRRFCPGSPAAILSGPSFAVDIAAGLPTALTIATDGPGEALQGLLSTRALRLYRSEDTLGVEIGGALKNVIAIACGIVMGAGLGESAKAALMTRGYAEMMRYAQALGADPRTLMGLSGFGDLVLTCGSPKSRNYAHGLALGAGQEPPRATVEGVATAHAVTRAAEARGIDLPISSTLSRVLDRKLGVAEAVEQLMSRPLRAE
jgi:glycerol-3-phosphate dehydrogenase (NAD(P)+)